MSENLVPRPCPLCGARAFCHQHSAFRKAVLCTECEAEGPLRESEADAISAWNRRSADERDAARWRYARTNPAVMYEKWEPIALSPEECDSAVDSAMAMDGEKK